MSRELAAESRPKLGGRIQRYETRIRVLAGQETPVQVTLPAGARLHVRLAGSEAPSEVLPAGRFRVEARLPGGRVVLRTVVLVDGETTAVDLSFE